MSSRPAIAGFGALGLFWGAWASLLPSVQQATGASKSELGVALLCVAVGSIPSTLPGRVADRPVRQRRRTGLDLRLRRCGGAAWTRDSVPVLALALVIAGATSGAMDVAVNPRASGGRGRDRPAPACISHTRFFPPGSSSARWQPASRGRPEPAASRSCSALPPRSSRSGCGIAGPDQRSPGEASLRLSRALAVLGVVALIAFVVEGGLEAGALLPGATCFRVAGGELARARTLRLDDGPRTRRGTGGRRGVRRPAAARSRRAGRRGRRGPRGLVTGDERRARRLRARRRAGISVAAPILFGAAGRGLPGTQQGSAVGTVTTIGYAGFLIGPALMGAVSGAAGLRAGLAMLAGTALLARRSRVAESRELRSSGTIGT